VTICEFKFETESQDSLGIFVGAEYNLTDTAGLNAELRLDDQFAGTAGFFRTF